MSTPGRLLHLVGDATGVGEGLVDWLAARLDRRRVTPFKFTRLSKAALGAAFLALVESGSLSVLDGRSKRRSAATAGGSGSRRRTASTTCRRAACWNAICAGMCPASARVSTPLGSVPVHDDRLLSAALVAEADRLLRSANCCLGDARSAVLPPVDPFDDLEF